MCPFCIKIWAPLLHIFILNRINTLNVHCNKKQTFIKKPFSPLFFFFFFYWISLTNLYKRCPNYFNKTLKSQETKDKWLTLLQSHADDEKSQRLAHERSHDHLVSEVLMCRSSGSPERYRWVFSLEVGEQQQVLWIQVPDRTSTYTQPVGDNMMAPPTSVYSVVTQHTHTPPALLAFQRWPEHTVSVSALNRPRREERTM